MTSKYIRYCVFVIFSFIIGSCGSDIFHPKLDEGEIEYSVTYPLLDPDNVMADFMPDKMLLQFKDNTFKTELSAGMGMFKTNFIADCDEHSMSHLVKLVNKKYTTEYDDESVKKLNDVYEDFSIIETNDTKVIAGYKCKKLWVIFTDVTMPSFELYYTNDIDIKDANWSLPYLDVDGVMLEYLVKRNGMVMHLTATTVTKKEIDESIFEVPEEYETVTIDEMENELNSLFETFDY